MAIDPSGDFLVGVPDWGIIYKVTPGGSVSSFVTGLAGIEGLAVGPSGTIFVSSGPTGLLYKIQ